MTTRTRTSTIGEVRERYQIDEPQAVARYLRRHPGLAPLVVEARQRIAAVFGAETPVALSIIADPEIEHFSQLWALILVAPNTAGVSEKLEALDRTWWLAAQRGFTDVFAVDTEFV